MKQRVEEMEREANKLRELQAAAAASNNAEGVESHGGEAMETDEDKSVADSRSVFVGNVRIVRYLVRILTVQLDNLVFVGRSTTVQHQRRYKDISKRAEQ